MSKELSKPIELLLVEDDPSDIRIIRTLLKGRPEITVSACSDGERALEQLNGRLASEGAKLPDLILLDLNMPRKDGRDLLVEIKQDPRLSAIPIVVLTTSNSPEDEKTAYRLGACSFITKPHNLDEFEQVLDVMMDYWAMALQPR